MSECRLSGACAEEPRPKSLTTRCSPDQRRRPHPSTGCGLLVRKPHSSSTPTRLPLSCLDKSNHQNSCLNGYSKGGSPAPSPRQGRFVPFGRPPAVLDPTLHRTKEQSGPEVPRIPCPSIYSAASATVVQLGGDHSRGEGWNSGSLRCVVAPVD